MTDRPFLGYGRQTIDEADIAAVVEVLRGDFLTQGPAVERFEAALASYSGARHAVAVSSGTAALHLAALAAGVGPGDVGITSAITFVASANCLHYAGGRAALTDIDPQTLCMSPATLAPVLERHPEAKAVIPVLMGGLSTDLDEIRALAGDRRVILDASHALGARHPDGRPVGCGGLADMTVFSFHPVKPITTGEGGAILTDDDDLARHLRRLRTHGIERETLVTEEGRLGTAPWYYEQQELGFNYRLCDIQAALGMTQMAKLDGFIGRRRALAQRYDQAFAPLPHVRLPQSLPAQRAISGHHLYLVEVDFVALGVSRAQVMAALRAKGVGSQVHYIPVHHQPFHAPWHPGPEAFPAAEDYYRRCLSLPLHPGLSDSDQTRVIEALSGILACG